MKFAKLTVLLLLVHAKNCFAQDIQLKQIEINSDGKISFCRPASVLNANPANEQALLRKIIQTDNQLEAKLTRTVKDDSTVHNFYRFALKGILIEGADYVIHSTNGHIDFANGKVPIITDITMNTKISYEEAKRLLNIQLMSQYSNNKVVRFEYTDRGLIWIYKNGVTSLAYKIETIGKGVLLSGLYYIDARTGKQLAFSSFICTLNGTDSPPPNAAGTAQTLYSGTQDFTTDAISGGFRLRETRNNVNILTLNANYQDDEEALVPTATDFSDNDNNWQILEHSADAQSFDVHWASEKVLDYLRTQLNRNSLDNNGTQVRSFVHVNTTDGSGNSIPMDDAYYYGNPYASTSTHSMYYGDGAVIGKPFVSLDIVAHEMGHGIDEYTSQFGRDKQNEGQALGEGLSDIWAATIEHWAAPNKQPWLIGEDIMKNGFSCLRSLRSPKTEGYLRGYTTEGNYPDTYRKTNWDLTNLDPHRNSTVLGHWYYLLVTGGSGTNDLGNAFVVNGIGFDKAINIVYKAQKDYLNLFADFPIMRSTTIAAAQFLYGVNSCEEKEVTNAWYAVGVGAAFAITLPQTSLSMSGVQNFCNFIDVTLNNVPCNLTATWSADPAGLVNFSCQNCNQTTVTTLASGSVTLTATISSNGVTQNLNSQAIHVGSYTSNDYTITWNNGTPPYYCFNQTITFTLSGPAAANYNWSWPTGWSLVYNGASYVVLRSPPSSGYPPTGSVTVTFAEPTCGVQVSKSFFVAYNSNACGTTSPYSISPNPASSSITIYCTSLQTYCNIAQVQITDIYGNIKSSQTWSNTMQQVQMPVSFLTNGTYIAKIYSGTQWYSNQFIVQH